MLRLHPKTDTENIPCMHYSFYAKPTYPLHRMEQELSTRVHFLPRASILYSDNITTGSCLEKTKMQEMNWTQLNSKAKMVRRSIDFIRSEQPGFLQHKKSLRFVRKHGHSKSCGTLCGPLLQIPTGMRQSWFFKKLVFWPLSSIPPDDSAGVQRRHQEPTYHVRHVAFEITTGAPRL